MSKYLACYFRLIVGAHSFLLVPRSASWRFGYLSSWFRNPTSTFSTACFYVTWRRETTWRTNHRKSGSRWRTVSHMMPCKDRPLTFNLPELHALPALSGKSFLHIHIGEYESNASTRCLFQMSCYFLYIIHYIISKGESLLRLCYDLAGLWHCWSVTYYQKSASILRDGFKMS